ncbi:MAG: Maf family nucleotide pyrophosphatase [Herbaspirillum sp.]
MPDSSSVRIVLGSSSRYRQELLARLQLPFDVIAPDLDETPLKNEAPHQTAIRLAHAKACAVAQQAPGALIISSDQLASLHGAPIGKPGSHRNALRQLQQLRGQRVAFHTALCVLDDRAAAPGGRIQLAQIDSFVTFRDLPDHELDAYLRLEQPYDCAGSAKNEGLGIALIAQIESTDPTALTGLPLIALTSMLRKAGISFFGTK